MNLTVLPRDLPVQHLDGLHVAWVTTQYLRLQRKRLPRGSVFSENVFLICKSIYIKFLPKTLRQEVVSVDNSPDLPRLVMKTAW